MRQAQKLELQRAKLSDLMFYSLFNYPIISICVCIFLIKSNMCTPTWYLSRWLAKILILPLPHSVSITLCLPVSLTLFTLTAMPSLEKFINSGLIPT